MSPATPNTPLRWPLAYAASCATTGTLSGPAAPGMSGMMGTASPKPAVADSTADNPPPTSPGGAPDSSAPMRSTAERTDATSIRPVGSSGSCAGSLEGGTASAGASVVGAASAG
eukprot:58544-Chlamydomonas_euryale.AAC.1